MKGISIVREDGLRGTVSDVEEAELLIDFEDGSRSKIKPETLVEQEDGSYLISSSDIEEEKVIQLIQEEFTVETEKVETARVTVNKRVETREEVVYTPTTSEEVVIEHIPINKLLDNKIPKVRKTEDGVLIIPVVEEIVVVEKRLLFKEEVHISKRRITTNVPQTIVLRREVIDVERTELNNIDDITTPIEEETDIDNKDDINKFIS